MARKRIGEGIWREGNKLYADARAHSSRDGKQAREIRSWDLGTDVSIIRAWRSKRHGELIAERPRVARGTLAADIDQYVADLPEGRYRYDAAQLLAHWAASDLGGISRHTIARREIVNQIARWTERGVSASACNRRLSRLRQVFVSLDPPNTPNPTDAIKFRREPEIEPRDISPRIVKAILDALPDVGRGARGEKRPTVSLTKIRLRVMAWIGAGQATIVRLQKQDLRELARRKVYLRRREKGGTVDGKWIKVTAPAVDALRAFAAANLFGLPWSNSSAGDTWRVGIARATAAAARHADETGDTSWRDELANLPPGCKPYDLRHSFGSEVYRRTGDFRAVAELLQHAPTNLKSTARYTKGAVSERVTVAIETVGPLYENIPSLPPPARPQRALRIVKRA